MSDELEYAVGFSDKNGLVVAARVVRRPSGIYVLMKHQDSLRREHGKREARAWNPHASYHADGTLHLKSYDERPFEALKRQPLDAAFTGSEEIFAQGIRPSDFLNAADRAEQASFADCFDVALASLKPAGFYELVYHLLAPNTSVESGSWRGTVVAQKSFSDAAPWIQVSLSQFSNQ